MQACLTPWILAAPTAHSNILRHHFNSTNIAAPTNTQHLLLCCSTAVSSPCCVCMRTYQTPPLMPSLEVKLPEGLHKGAALDVTHSPAQLNDTHIRHTRHAIHWDVSNTLDPILDGICDVRDHLHTCVSVTAAAAACATRQLHPAAGATHPPSLQTAPDVRTRTHYAAAAHTQCHLRCTNCCCCWCNPCQCRRFAADWGCGCCWLVGWLLWAFHSTAAAVAAAVCPLA